MSQAPKKVEKVSLTDREGHTIVGKEYQPIKTRENKFNRYGKDDEIIQDRWPGHIYCPEGTPGNQSPHINIRPINDTRSGKVSGTLEHYPF